MAGADGAVVAAEPRPSLVVIMADAQGWAQTSVLNVCPRVPATGCDLLPTLAALAGSTAPLPGAVEGGSLVAVLHE